MTISIDLIIISHSEGQERKNQLELESLVDNFDYDDDDHSHMTPSNKLYMHASSIKWLIYIYT